MNRILPLLLGVVLAGVSPAHAKDEKWVEARSKNFIVVSNASASQARNTAIQFEQIRELFQRSFAFTKDRPTPVVTILAAKDENTLKELLPEYWAEKGHMHPAGIFISNLFQSAVAVQLSGMGDNPYEAVYHEYYHSLTVPYFPELPAWLAEGLADFYGNSHIGDKIATLGIPNPGLVELLHQQSLIPLSTLFQVDHTSPYYNEGSKVSIFYAESWALTHYFMLGEKGTHRNELMSYLAALGQGVSQDEAAAKSFGDLGKLQKSLQSYLNNSTLYDWESPAPPKIPESDVQVRPLSDAEANAYRGGFLALHQQYKEADALLQGAVRLDPKLALAQQNLGGSDYLQTKPVEALAALSAAIELDPKNTLTRFLRADLVSHESGSGQSDSQVEGDLRAAIAIDPNFAPAYGLLATHLVSRGEHLPEAFEFAKKGATLEEGNSFYQLVLAQVLARMRQYDQAQVVATHAKANALDPVSKNNADRFIEYLQRLKAAEDRNNHVQEDTDVATNTDGSPADSTEEDENEPEVADGTQRVDGTVTDVQCKVQEMQITISAQGGTGHLHSLDNTKIDFISDIPVKSEEFWPCTSLKGRLVRVTYVPSVSSKARPYQGEIEKLEIKR